MKLTLNGVQKFWAHEGLVNVIQKKTGWSAPKLREFLMRNDKITFNGIDQQTALVILEEIEYAGFDLQRHPSHDSMMAILTVPRNIEIATLKRDLAALTARLEALESGTSVAASSKPVLPPASFPQTPEREPSGVLESVTPVSKTNSEGNIGKYWLSRFGIFTLILGIVLFLSYSFQFIGPQGKILIGIVIGALMTGAGNYFSQTKKYEKWAMGLIGGGWAVIYFSIYAAYAVPATKIIQSPFVGLAGLLLVSAASIGQSLKFKSPVMVIFSYFLGYLAITMVHVSFYTLAASFLLAVSIVAVTRRMGWSWLALLGLGAVYMTHFVWLQPVMQGFMKNSNTDLFEMIYLPWAGEEWRLYPLINSAYSKLHQCFLILYWALFTTIGFFKIKNAEDEKMNLSLLLLNSFIFTAAYMHHLHVYYPDMKFLLPLLMGLVYALLFAVEKKINRPLFADLYLAFSVTLLCLSVPLLFDGPWITYGWSAASVVLAWIGVRHQTKILRVIGWVLAVVVGLRLISLDFRESTVLFHAVMPVRSSLFLFLTAAASFFGVFSVYRRTENIPQKERRWVQDAFLIGAFTAFGLGILFGGFRATASVVWAFEGVILMVWSLRKNHLPGRVAACAFLFLAALRFASVDYALHLLAAVSDLKTAVRLTAAALSLCAFLKLADWMRTEGSGFPESAIRTSRIMTAVAAFLTLCYFLDPGISSWVSIIWGILAFAFITAGFVLRDKIYRWCGLAMFAFVALRLFFHDFSKLETVYRIVSFMGLGAVFIAASFLYSYYSKVFLIEEKK